MRRTNRAQYDTGSVDVSESVWAAGTSPTRFGPLEGERRTDVAVIGAGLAGSSLVLHLAEQGAGVALVEAHEPGWGASGRNAGHAVPYREVDRALARLPDRGERFLDLFRKSNGIVYELAAKHAIECDAVQGGYLQVAHHRALVSDAQKKAERWAARGFAVRFAGRDEVAAMTGTEAFHGGVLAEKGGRLNPFLFTRGLAEAAERQGARVFVRSPVESVVREGGNWVVRTPNGRVRADRVVACTNGYTGNAIPAMAKAWCPLVAFAIATTPVPEDVRATVLPAGCAMSLVPAGHRPMVVDGRGRIVSSLLAPNLRPQRPPFRWLERWLRKTFPQLAPVNLEVSAYWTGSMAWSTDELPRIFDVAPGFLALTCFSGEGNIPAPMLGRHLAERLVEDDLKSLVLPLQPPTVPRWRGRYDFVLRKVGVPALRVAERLGLY